MRTGVLSLAVFLFVTATGCIREPATPVEVVERPYEPIPEPTTERDVVVASDDTQEDSEQPDSPDVAPPPDAAGAPAAGSPASGAAPASGSPGAAAAAAGSPGAAGSPAPGAVAGSPAPDNAAPLAALPAPAAAPAPKHALAAHAAPAVRFYPPDPVLFRIGAGYGALGLIDFAPCRGQGLEKGYLHMRVTFRHSGRVVRASVERPAPPPDGALQCIAQQLQATMVPSFDGEDVTLSKSYFVN
jgi:hypothetical protein